jgi:hypothetical protein
VRGPKQELEAAWLGVTHELIVVDDSNDWEAHPLLREVTSHCVWHSVAHRTLSSRSATRYVGGANQRPAGTVRFTRKFTVPCGSRRERTHDVALAL